MSGQPSAPWETLVVCVMLLLAAAAAAPRRTSWWREALLVGTLGVSLFSSSAGLAFVTLAVAALVHALGAKAESRTGAAALVCAAAVTALAGLAASLGSLTAAFVLSTAAIALRAGVLPFHLGAASLCERLPLIQAEQLSTMIALVFVHLRFVDHHAGAAALGPWLVRYGAAACMTAALMSIVQRDLRGFYRTTNAMHGGMLMAALGTASLGNFGAALLVAVSMSVALGGLGMMITSLEKRVGAVDYAGPGGRGPTFPKIATLFALFGGAGVGLPATSSFVADDLLLHTLWMQSPVATFTVILSSALLAVATLICLSRVFLGRATPSLAPDLGLGERLVGTALVLLLVTLGFVPSLLLGPAEAFLSSAPPG